LVVVNVGNHLEDLRVFFCQEFNHFGVFLVEKELGLDLVECFFARLLFLVGFLKVFQPDEVQRLVADVDILDCR
jgi:hypothetical protein